MLYKCKHQNLMPEKCPDCNKKPTTYQPGQTLGNRRPEIMKAKAGKPPLDHDKGWK